MKLSTKGRYGLKAMLELAVHSGEKPMPLKLIAEHQDISEPYLEQLISLLRKSGLVKSVRGAQGGYQLAMPAEEITVGDILRALEGPIAPTDCVSEEENYDCERLDYCVTRLIWEKIRDSISNVVDNITLQDMAEEHKKKYLQKVNMYYI